MFATKQRGSSTVVKVVAVPVPASEPGEGVGVLGQGGRGLALQIGRAHV